MKFEDYVVVKQGNDWLIGKIKGYEFTPYKQIKKLADVKNVSSYIPLKKYLAKNKFKPTLANLLLKKIGLSSIYVLNRPSYIGEDEWDDYWWSDHCEKCGECVKDCKQSQYATVKFCPDYEEKDDR